MKLSDVLYFRVFINFLSWTQIFHFYQVLSTKCNTPLSVMLLACRCREVSLVWEKYLHKHSTHLSSRLQPHSDSLVMLLDVLVNDENSALVEWSVKGNLSMDNLWPLLNAIFIYEGYFYADRKQKLWRGRHLWFDVATFFIPVLWFNLTSSLQCVRSKSAREQWPRTSLKCL